MPAKTKPASTKDKNAGTSPAQKTPGAHEEVEISESAKPTESDEKKEELEKVEAGEKHGVEESDKRAGEEEPPVKKAKTGDEAPTEEEKGDHPVEHEYQTGKPCV